MLEVVRETKLLGIILTDNLKWDANTDYICGRAMKKLWTLRRLKKLGADRDSLIEVYTKEVRSVLEFAVPVWHSSISQKTVKI